MTDGSKLRATAPRSWIAASQGVRREHAEPTPSRQ